MTSINVRYFASIREKLGRSEDQVEAVAGETARNLWKRVSGLPFPANTLVAINQEYASSDTPVQAGDEVAFFPPVTGG